MKLQITFTLAATMIVLPAIGFAEAAPKAVSTDMIWIMNILLFLVGGFLVFFMAAGFAMLEAGLVRSKNVTMQLIKNMGLFSIVCLAYCVIGYNLMYPLGTWSVEKILPGALILGSRLWKYKDGGVVPMLGSNLPLATLGTFILWLGWFGFSGGSQLAMGTIGDIADVSRIFVNTNMAAASGAFVAMVATQLTYGKVDLTMVLNGALAGLVSSTAEPLTPTMAWTRLIGGVGGLIVVPLLDKVKIDDVVGAIPMHLFAGIWGTLAVVLTNPDAVLAT